jgi:hypothetical protein
LRRKWPNPERDYPKKRCFLEMTDVRSKELYSSPNGDRWLLCKDASGCVFVAHHPNAASGGKASRIELATFLSRGRGPEQQALLQLIGSILDAAPGELLGGEGSPGLCLGDGGGHA